MNKYIYLHVVQGQWCFGWEDESASEDAREAHRDLRDYRENQPEVSHRMIERREPNPEYRQPVHTGFVVVDTIQRRAAES